jgi:ferrochelatase
MRFSKEPSFSHGTVPALGATTAVLYCNLGTPDAPTPAAVRRYLKEFLSDPRVVEIPRIAWWPILHGVVLNVRPRQSARKYAAIWDNAGSPLKLHTERQTRLLGEFLAGGVGSPLVVDYSMRYGEPSIATVLARLKAAGCDRILVLPLYPQYAASSTATAFDEVARHLTRTRNQPEMRWVKHFHDHPAYIAALAAQVREHWEKNGRGDKLLFSFHGLPRYTLERGDPYHCECQKTARLVAESLELAEGDWQLAFQSRFGRTEWLKPHTLPTLQEYARQGVQRVDVLCPGFVADCLETLEEIGIECKQAFLAAGGRQFHLLPCLNERDDWIRALGEIALEHLSGWLDPSLDSRKVEAAAQRSRDRALGMGAKQ